MLYTLGLVKKSIDRIAFPHPVLLTVPSQRRSSLACSVPPYSFRYPDVLLEWVLQSHFNPVDREEGGENKASYSPTVIDVDAGSYFTGTIKIGVDENAKCSLVRKMFHLYYMYSKDTCEVIIAWSNLKISKFEISLTLNS